MKKLIALAVSLTLLFALTAWAEEKVGSEQPIQQQFVKPGIGAMTIGGNIKAGFNWYLGTEKLLSTKDQKTVDVVVWTVGEDGEPTWTVEKQADGKITSADVLNRMTTERNQRFDFTVNALLLKANGWIVDQRVTYLVSLSGDTTNGTISLLDMNLNFSYIPFTTLQMGRILPSMTYFCALPQAQFKTIDLPLMNKNLLNRSRQTGLNVALVTTYLDANLGAYNGRQYNPTWVPDDHRDAYISGQANAPSYKSDDFILGNSNYLDQNTGKDVHFGLVGKLPIQGFNIRANALLGMPLDYFHVKEGKKSEYNVQVLMLNGGIDYLAPYGLVLAGDFLWGQYNWDSKFEDTSGETPARTKRVLTLADGTTKSGEEAYTNNLMSYYVMAGYNFGPLFQVPIEILGRYDWYDPDTLNNKKYHPDSEDDQLTDITGGLNYYLKGYNAMVSLNYIHHAEQWKEVWQLGEDAKYAADPNRQVQTQTGIANDEIKFQFSLAF